MTGRGHRQFWRRGTYLDGYGGSYNNNYGTYSGNYKYTSKLNIE